MKKHDTIVLVPQRISETRWSADTARALFQTGSALELVASDELVQFAHIVSLSNAKQDDKVLKSKARHLFELLRVKMGS